MHGKCTAAKEKGSDPFCYLKPIKLMTFLFVDTSNNISHSKLLSGFQSRGWITQ